MSLVPQNEELFDRKGKYFNVERVGQVRELLLTVVVVVVLTVTFVWSLLGLQYLKDEDEDLVSPPNTKGNQWLKFLQESTHLKGKLMMMLYNGCLSLSLYMSLSLSNHVTVLQRAPCCSPRSPRSLSLSNHVTLSSREPPAVPLIPPEVVALREEDDGECDRGVSPETRRESSASSRTSNTQEGSRNRK